MPIIVFWLTPVVLAIIFIIFLLSQTVGKKPKVFLVEPLFFLVQSWQLARFEGNQTRLRELLEDWLPGLELQQSIIEQLVRQIILTPPAIPTKDLTVLSQRTLTFWGEERTLEKSGKKISVLAGPISEVLSYCDADSNGPLAPEQRVNWAAKAETAHNNGFWTLALGESASPDAMLRKKYQLAGLLILEPMIDQQAVMKLREAAGLGEIRLISIAAGSFLHGLAEKVFPARPEKVVTGQELSTMSPSEQEKAVERATIYGEVGRNNRYWIARHLQRRARLLAFSRLPLDNDLPCDQRL